MSDTDEEGLRKHFLDVQQIVERVFGNFPLLRFSE